MEWIVFGLIYLYFQGDGDVLAGAEDFLASITQGARVTHASYDTSTGVVYATPQDLADQAGVDLDTYSLARMLASEEGQSDSTTKAAVALAAVNYAAQVGNSVSGVLLHAVDPNHSGYFGTFKNIDPSSPFYGTDSSGTPNKADRYASTALDPYQGDIEIAVNVTFGGVQDFTGGATQYDRPAGEKNPAAVADKRTSAGAQPVNVPGVDPGLRFWRPSAG